MNGINYTLLGVALLFAVTVGVTNYRRRRKEDKGELSGLKGQLYRPANLPYGWFIGYVLMATLFSPLLFGSRREELIARSFDNLSLLCLILSAYYALLLCLLPLLRRRLEARCCAALWLMPSVLYLFANVELSALHPLRTIHVPQALARRLWIIWIAGFCAVLLGELLLHLRFRRVILRSAAKVEEGSAFELLRGEMARVGEEKLPLVISPAAKTPLIVGLLRDELVLVLPERAYCEEELRLIFRHELVHLQREDVWLKCFMLFCAAMLWFDPLLWLAMRRAAEDAELSCDETVMAGAGAAERRLYAELILSTAGDARGFSTCLSASARGLRYRLRSIVKPEKKRRGILLLSALSFLLVGSCGLLCVAVG